MTPICLTRPEWVKGVVCKNIFFWLLDLFCFVCSSWEAICLLLSSSPVFPLTSHCSCQDIGVCDTKWHGTKCFIKLQLYTPAIVRKVNFILRRKHGQTNVVVWVYVMSSVIWLFEGNFNVIYPMCTHKVSSFSVSDPCLLWARPLGSWCGNNPEWAPH